jgi:hypothetical protein
MAGNGGCKCSLNRPLDAQRRGVEWELQFRLAPIDITVFPEKNPCVPAAGPVRAKRQRNPRNIRERFGHHPEIALVEKQTGPEMCAEVSNRFRIAGSAKTSDAPFQPASFAAAQVVGRAAVMLAVDELEACDLDSIVIDDAAKQETAMFFRWIEALIFILETPGQGFDEIQRDPNRERTHPPEIKDSFRHNRDRSNSVAGVKHRPGRFECAAKYLPCRKFGTYN